MMSDEEAREHSNALPFALLLIAPATKDTIGRQGKAKPVKRWLLPGYPAGSKLERDLVPEPE